MRVHSPSWTFLHINDNHMGTPRSYRFCPAINHHWSVIKRQMSAIEADFLLHGGDLTRDGDTHEYEYQMVKDDLETLPFPTFVIPGNMDVGNKHTHRNGPYLDRDDVSLNMSSDRLRLFASYFGPLAWTFLHKRVRFTGFFAAVAGSGLREEERFWYFMERLGKLSPARHHVAIMHYWLFMDDLDEPTWDITKEKEYLSWYFSIDPPHRHRIFDLLKAAKVEIVFCGHIHTGRPVQVVDGIRFYKTSAAGNFAQLADRWPDAELRQGFHRCDVTDDGIEVTFVPCEDIREDFDRYGPTGHPKIEARDYSIARERPPLAPDPWLIGASAHEIDASTRADS